MKKIVTTVVSAFVAAGISLSGAAIAEAAPETSAASETPTALATSTASATSSTLGVIHCPSGSYAIVVDPGPVWGCTKSVWEQGHHRRHPHPWASQA